MKRYVCSSSAQAVVGRTNVRLMLDRRPWKSLSYLRMSRAANLICDIRASSWIWLFRTKKPSLWLYRIEWQQSCSDRILVHLLRVSRRVNPVSIHMSGDRPGTILKRFWALLILRVSTFSLQNDRPGTRTRNLQLACH